MQNPENDQTVATQVALLKQSIENMSKNAEATQADFKQDLTEIKQEFKDFKLFYVTKEQLANAEARWKTAHNSLAGDFENLVSLWKRIFVGVVIVVIAAVVLYALHVPNVP